MEGNKDNVETQGNVDTYPGNKIAGYAEAEAIINAADGFDRMDYRGKFGFLHQKLNELVLESASSYAIEYIATAMHGIEKEIEKEKIDEDLQKIREYYGEEMSRMLETAA